MASAIHYRVEVQQFLGLANYSQRFVKDFAILAKPSTNIGFPMQKIDIFKIKF